MLSAGNTAALPRDIEICAAEIEFALCEHLRMAFAVTFAKSAVKELQGLQPKKAAAVRAAIQAVAADPREEQQS
jgi:hypothetical protein